MAWSSIQERINGTSTKAFGELSLANIFLIPQYNTTLLAQINSSSHVQRLLASIQPSHATPTYMQPPSTKRSSLPVISVRLRPHKPLHKSAVVVLRQVPILLKIRALVFGHTLDKLLHKLIRY